MKNQLGLPTAAYADVFIFNLEILFLCAVSLLSGRAISDLFNEITERKQAEEALRASEERLNLALTGGNDGLWDWNVQTGEAYFSPRWKAMLSYAEHELPNTYDAWDSRLHPHDKERVLKTLQEHFNDESRMYAPEFRMLTKAGGWIWIRARGRVVQRDNEGHPLRMAGTHTDITEQKQTEEILRKSEERFSKAFHDSPAGLSITSLADGMFIDVNESFLSMFEYRRAEVIGHTSIELNMLRPEARAKSIQQLNEQGRLTNFELQMQAKSGRLLNVLFSTEQIELNGMACALATIIDITDRKRAEQELETYVDELNRRNTELVQFTYTVSHDLRNPLVTIKGFLGMLDKDLKENRQDKIQSDFQRIAGAADKMDELLTDLLELSRIGRIINPSERIDLVQLAQDAVETLDGRIKSRNVTVKVSADLPDIYGDRLRLREVLENLIDNAAKYTGQQLKPLIEIDVRKSEDEQVIFVKDNGLGIEPRYHSKIFDLFEKLNPNSEGTGIGLALVKRIIEVHGGRVWVESEGLGKGSTFCFMIPNGRKANHQIDL